MTTAAPKKENPTLINGPGGLWIGTATTMERWCAKVRLPSDGNGCWEWVAAKSANYGRFYSSEHRRLVMAYRYGYERFIAPIAKGLHLDHLCRNTFCVNPAHLEPVTCRTNLLRGVGVTAINAQASSCPLGHPYDEANTYRWRGTRRCRKCNTASQRRTKARRRIT